MNPFAHLLGFAGANLVAGALGVSIASWIGIVDWAAPAFLPLVALGCGMLLVLVGYQLLRRISTALKPVPADAALSARKG